jgi:hypothetical protein
LARPIRGVWYLLQSVQGRGLARIGKLSRYREVAICVWNVLHIKKIILGKTGRKKEPHSRLKRVILKKILHLFISPGKNYPSENTMTLMLLAALKA